MCVVPKDAVAPYRNCTQPCNLVSPQTEGPDWVACPDGFRCIYQQAVENTPAFNDCVSIPPHVSREGEPCNGFSDPDCEPLNVCVGNICHRYCYFDAGPCPNGKTCVQMGEQQDGHVEKITVAGGIPGYCN